MATSVRVKKLKLRITFHRNGIFMTKYRSDGTENYALANCYKDFVPTEHHSQLDPKKLICRCG
jgi:hypothetical protein